MKDLNYQLKKLGEENRDGSYNTQAQRAFLLSQIANQLHELGYRRLSVRSLKQKHVGALVTLWHSQNLSAGTIKNRMAALRWWARKVGKQSVLAKDNDHYGIERRCYVSRESKALKMDPAGLTSISDPHVRLSLRLQREFGLRREESIKFRVHEADRADHIRLKASWTKGGKARNVPIRTAAQRALLDELRRFCGQASLIPADKTFIQQLRVYVREVMQAGLSRMHGLRHAYAQARYLDLAGFESPVAGGPARTALSSAQRELDDEARRVVSRELGHERSQITTVYLGR